MHSRVDPAALVTAVCAIAGSDVVMARFADEIVNAPIRGWVRERDNPALFDWLMDRLGYQGISDLIAERYIAQHGNVTYHEIERALSASTSTCPKLRGFEAYRDCRYRKGGGTCMQPSLRQACPVPTHDLRNGVLNQVAYSLFFFLRDVCDGDLVGFIDRTLEAADRPGHPDRLAMMREALLSSLGRIHGVGFKVLSIALADLLMAADPDRPLWYEVGSTLVAIDSLIHNFLHRTGILRRWRCTHAYGPSCYGKEGCAHVVDRLTRQIDARAFDPRFPTYFPRFIEHSLWAFCAGQQLAICNGNTVDDRARCAHRECPVFHQCEHLALRPVLRKKAAPAVDATV